MAAAALIDAGPLVAAGNKRDRRHVRSVRFIGGFEGTLVTTWPVLTEVCHFAHLRILNGGKVPFPGGTAKDKARRHCEDTPWHPRRFNADLSEEFVEIIADMMEKYADLPMDLADASLVWLGDETGIRDIVTFDERDFGTYRLASGKRFNNLMPT